MADITTCYEKSVGNNILRDETLKVIKESAITFSNENGKHIGFID